MKKKKLTVSRIIMYLFLIITAVSTIYPVIFMMLSSFKDKIDYMKNMFGLPSVWRLNNYRAIFNSFDIRQMMFNSFYVTIAGVIVSLAVTSMAAFSLTKLKYEGRNGIFSLFMFVLMVPGQALMMPIYVIMSKMGLVNTRLSVILVYVATSIAFSTYLLCQNCRDIPDEIIEAARIDGASYPRVFAGMILPMLRPTLATLAILNFLSYWNEIVYSRLLLQKTELQTMTLGLLTLNGKYGTNMPLLMSGLIINLIPALMIFLIFNKYLSKGIAMGSGK